MGNLKGVQEKNVLKNQDTTLKIIFGFFKPFFDHYPYDVCVNSTSNVIHKTLDAGARAEASSVNKPNSEFAHPFNLSQCWWIHRGWSQDSLIRVS